MDRYDIILMYVKGENIEMTPYIETSNALIMTQGPGHINFQKIEIIYKYIIIKSYKHHIEIRFSSSHVPFSMTVSHRKPPALQPLSYDWYVENIMIVFVLLYSFYGIIYCTSQF